jgi:acyl-CoA synthetase (AMP-forming)/AMP-acid ligase II
VFVPLSIELYTALIGAWSIGAVPIFIDFSQGAKFVNDSSREGLVSTTKLDGDYPAIMTLTSGTTGLPKVAVRSHDFLINQYHVLARHFDFNEEHIDLGTLPVFTLANLAAGMTTLLPEKSYRSQINFARLAKQMEDEKVSRAICSPDLMANLLQYSNFPSLQNVYLGGGPVYPGLLNAIREDIDLDIVYGSTEAEPISGIHWKDVDSADRQKIAEGAGLPVGFVVPEVECRIGDEEEIQVSGDTVLSGYLDGVGDSENKIHEDGKIWHRTGDAGYFDEQGRLWLLGRISQAVHDEHGTLYPFSVECVLDANFGIRGAVLIIKGNRTVVIEDSSVNPSLVLERLGPLHIKNLLTIQKIPMDKRHNAKIDYERLRLTIADFA